MRCLYCRRRIGSVRRLIDKEFCSSDHRRRFRASSARVLRDSCDLADNYDDYLAVVKEPERRGQATIGKLGVAIAGVLGLVVVASLALGPQGGAPRSDGSRYSLPSNALGQGLSLVFPDGPKINLRQDFRMGLGEWLTSGPSSGRQVPGGLRADRLRLWKPSLELTDYQLEFQAEIERNAVGWAFRASDLANFYGTKIYVGGKDGGRAEIERFVTVGGKQLERVRLPIPVGIRPDTLYRVRVRVKGDQFLTSVDGQVVDSWKDRRLRKGGVGFFSDRGESALVRWVSLSEPESFLSRLFAFGFHRYLPPAERGDVQWIPPSKIHIQPLEPIGG